MARLRKCSRSPYCRLKVIMQIGLLGLILAIAWILATGPASA